MSAPLRVELGAIEEGALRLVGGKALGCARLARLGFRVPPTSVLTTEALRVQLATAALAPAYAQFCQAVRGGASDDVLSAQAQALSRALAEAPLVPAVGEALRSIAAERPGPFAVRSSATAEDSAQSAFAGVFHSVLDVDASGLEAAARECWAAAFTPAAVTHALRNLVDPAALGVALLVQDLVPARRAGVLFTLDPSGQEPGLALLTEVGGRAEALMQGDQTGKTFRFTRGAPPPADPAHARLFGAIDRLERELHGPQDVEWVEAADGLWFVQARPITTVELKDGPPIPWTRELSEERFPKPISPLGWSQIQTVLAVNLETLRSRFGLTARRPQDVARTLRHYVYSNEQFFKIPGSLKPNPLAHLRYLPGYLWHLATAAALLPFALASKVGARVWLFCQAVRAAVFPHAREIRQSWDSALRHHLESFARLEKVDPRELTREGLVAHREAIEKTAREYMEPDLAVYVVKVACAWLVEQLGERLYGTRDPAFLRALTGGLEDNITLRMNQSIEALATSLAKDPASVELLRAERYAELAGSLDAESRAAYQRFLEGCGHLTTNWDLMEPTWGEAPEKIFSMVRSAVLAPTRARVGADLAAQASRARAARDDALARLPPMLRGFFRELLSTLHVFMRIDEEHHFYASRPYRAMRALCAEIGRRLVEARVLERADDVYFLERDELYAALAQPTFTRRYLVQARRGSFERSAAVRPPTRFLDLKPLPEPGEAPSADGLLHGVGASPGVATGLVRVLHHESEIADFQAGEILVTASPKPTWTPVFAVAAAVVSSTGSALSHGLVLAREYNLPAVIGIAGVTQRLKTGQRVTVDGDRGTLRILS